MQRQFWRNIHKRAVKDACHALKIEGGERAMIAVLLAILIIAGIWLFGSHEMAAHELIVRIGLTAAVIVVFPFVYCWKFIAAPAKIHSETEEMLNDIRKQLALAKSPRAKLEVRPPYLRMNGNGCWYFDLFNYGPSVADNITVKLIKFSPEPSAEVWKRIHLPYSVLPVSRTANMGGVRINPGHHEIFKIVRFAPTGTGAYVVWQFGQPANVNDQQFQMEKNEQWKLSYTITGANTDEIHFILIMLIQGNNLVCQ
jgi:hypothetical protein